MIDVRFVIGHGLWILGTAIVLAAFSYHEWLARVRERRLPDVLRESRAWKRSVAAGLLVVASAFLLMEGTRWWVWGGWLAVWAAASVELWRLRTRS